MSWFKVSSLLVLLFALVACEKGQRLTIESDSPVGDGTGTNDFPPTLDQASALRLAVAELNWVGEISILEFGERVPDTEVILSLVMTNNGEQDASVQEITTNSGSFRVVDPEACPTVAASDVCTIEIAFKPLLPGTFDGQVSVTWSNGEDENLVLTANVNGTGEEFPTSVLVSSEEQFLFGDVVTGQAVPFTVQLANSGNANLEILEVSGLDPDFATATHDCPASIIPTGTCNLTVTFESAKATRYRGTLIIRYQDSQEHEKLLALLVLGSAHDLLFTGAGPGGGPHLKALNSVNFETRWNKMAYHAEWAGGIFVGSGDINGDGVKDAITGAGAGGGPHVKVFNGLDGTELDSFFAFDAGFTGGVRVAGGDVNGDGRDDILCVTGPGAVVTVRVFSGTNRELLQEFTVFGGFEGGAFIAAGNVDGLGAKDIIVGADAGGGPHVMVFDGLTKAVLHSFFPYDQGFSGGAAVASADFNDDGKDDIITGAGPGGGPHVRVIDGTNIDNPIVDIFAYSAGWLGGVYVGTADANRDGQTDILTGARAGGGPHLRIFSGETFNPFREFFPYDVAFTGGVTVAGN